MTFVKARLLAVAGRHARCRRHVAPSVDDNNRYLKVTPLGDGVRLAYTVFFGEIPGRRRAPHDRHEPRRPDRRRRGQGVRRQARRPRSRPRSTSRSTASPQPRALADRRRRDGHATRSPPARSRSISSPTSAAAPARHAHACSCATSSASPGPARPRSRSRTARASRSSARTSGTPTTRRHDYRFVGPGGPLSDDGLEVEYTSTRIHTLGPRWRLRRNRQPYATTAPVPRWLWLVLAGVVAAGLGIVLARRRVKAS